MQRDYLGNPAGAQRDSTLRGIDDFIEGYLAYETRAERILAAADADPESCLANAYSGMLWMLLEAPEGARQAAKYLAAAERAAPQATRREQLNTAVLRAWVDDDMALTLRLCDQVSDEFPRDLVIVKTHQYFEFNRGINSLQCSSIGPRFDDQAELDGKNVIMSLMQPVAPVPSRWRGISNLRAIAPTAMPNDSLTLLE